MVYVTALLSASKSSAKTVIPTKVPGSALSKTSLLDTELSVSIGFETS